jgi:acyl-ACP thioesterase
LGFEGVHPLWIVRRTKTDLNKPIEFPDLLRLRRTTDVDRLKWKASLNPRQPRKSHSHLRVPGAGHRHRPVRLHEKRVVEDHLSAAPEVLNAPLRVTIEHEAPIALGYAG